MARRGTPKGGLDEIAERVYVNGADLTLVCYTNAANSLGPDTVAADLAQPTESAGYAPITLDGTWSSQDGIVTYEHNGPSDPDPVWTASGAWSEPVTGVALITGTRVVHFKDYREDGTQWVASAGRKLRVSLAELMGG